MDRALSLSPLVAAMSRPEFYSHHPDRVELVQTHISYVFFAGEHVYKIKKPVRFAFLDFSSIDSRRHFCHEEVRLNRRLAGDVYRGVCGIVPSGNGFALAPADASGAVEYAVHMRRLPADRVLTQLIDRGEATAELIDRIAARVAAFHATADAGPAVARGGDPARIAELMDADFREVAALHGDTISAEDDAAIQAWCHGALRTHDALLRQRQATGRIRDGHGDLHAAHVYSVDDDVVIIDCVEFNPAFRHRDVAADIAFLAMSLEYRERSDFATRFVSSYATAAADPDAGTLVPFYACQRAYIRGKVDSLKAREPEIDAADRAVARDSARRHFALALRYTWSDVRALVVVCGLSGTGKSTVAAALAARTGFAHINSDRVRKQLAGLRPTERGGAGLYTPARNAATYAAMYGAAADALAHGGGAILDATFLRRRDRDAAREVAARAGVPILFVECRADEESVRRRLAERARRGDDASDADWAVYAMQRRTQEPFAADEPRVCANAAGAGVSLIAPIERALARG